jgi:hypothetical protein
MDETVRAKIGVSILSKHSFLLGIAYNHGFETNSQTGNKRDFHEFSIGVFFLSFQVIVYE